jgi:hypothetical protein
VGKRVRLVADGHRDILSVASPEADAVELMNQARIQSLEAAWNEKLEPVPFMIT